MLSESRIEQYLVDACKKHGVFVRKVKWIARDGAPDRLLVKNGRHVWIELKSESAGPFFPSTPHEKAQQREHIRMRDAGCEVKVMWAKWQIDLLMEELV